MSSWLSHNRRPAQNAVIVALSALLRPPEGLLTRWEQKRAAEIAEAGGPVGDRPGTSPVHPTLPVCRPTVEVR
jgi:hypothetical protein